jgi:hypothetical protein
MEVNQLKELFKKYLKRDCTPEEVRVHGRKNYVHFEKEISNCDEYKKINSDFNLKNKIAILLTGHIRNMNILQTIRSFCNGYDYDIFVHTWDNLGIKGTETNLSAKVEKERVENELRNIPNIKEYIIENNKDFISSIDRREEYFNFSSPEEFIKSQLYSINKCFNLMVDYSKKENINYKLVIKLRFDCELTSFNVDEHLLNEINLNDIIFVPNNAGGFHDHMDNGTSCWACDNMYYKFNLKNVHIFEHTNVICDIFAYGSVKSMSSYCDLYNHYDDMLKSYNEENKKSLEKNKIKHTYRDGVYYIDSTHDGHLDTLYYLYCSYPERLIPKFLSDYMLVESKQITLKFIR